MWQWECLYTWAEMERRGQSRSTLRFVWQTAHPLKRGHQEIKHDVRICCNNLLMRGSQLVTSNNRVTYRKKGGKIIEILSFLIKTLCTRVNVCVCVLNNYLNI